MRKKTPRLHRETLAHIHDWNLEPMPSKYALPTCAVSNAVIGMLCEESSSTLAIDSPSTCPGPSGQWSVGIAIRVVPPMPGRRLDGIRLRLPSQWVASGFCIRNAGLRGVYNHSGNGCCVDLREQQW
jgi:hypothetical protein